MTAPKDPVSGNPPAPAPTPAENTAPVITAPPSPDVNSQIDEVAKKVAEILRGGQTQPPSGEAPKTLREIEEIAEAKVRAGIKELSASLAKKEEKAPPAAEGAPTEPPKASRLYKWLWGED